MKNFLMAVIFSCPLISQATLMALPEKPFIPSDNPQTVEKINLGKSLYFDPRLSRNGTLSCNSCHNLMLGGDDQRGVSIGVGGIKGERSSSTVWNSAFQTALFWDGRAKSLEDQAVGPIVNPTEMGMPHFDVVVARLNKIPGYVEMFEKVFGKNSISKENIGKAIASFERTLITRNSPFDKFVQGNKSALTPQMQRGLKLMQDNGCLSCHSGPNFSGENFKMGEGNFQKFPAFPENAYVKKYNLMADTGRFTVTNKKDDEHMWVVPTLRNIALTAPYFHNGSVKTLDEAVRVMARSQLDIDLKQDQVEDIVAFLGSLSGEFPKMDMPRLPPTPNITVVEE